MVCGKMAARAVALDLIERAAVAVFFGAMASSLLTSWQESGNIVSLVLLLSESTVVVFVVIRRYTSDVSVQPLDWLIALLGTTAPLLVRPTGGEPWFRCRSARRSCWPAWCFRSPRNSP